MTKINYEQRQKLAEDLNMITKCEYIKNCTYKQKQKNKNQYYSSLFKTIKQDFELREIIRELIHDKVNKDSMVDLEIELEKITKKEKYKISV